MGDGCGRGARVRSDDRVLTLRACESLELFAGSGSNTQRTATVQLPAAENPTEEKLPAEVAPPLASATRAADVADFASAPGARRPKRASTGAEPIAWASLNRARRFRWCREGCPQAWD